MAALPEHHVPANRISFGLNRGIAMQSQSLNGYWQVRRVGTQVWLPACVPGGIHTDLIAAGKLPDPFQGTNEEQAQWVAEKNWEYRRFFYPNPIMLRQERVWLN